MDRYSLAAAGSAAFRSCDRPVGGLDAESHAVVFIPKFRMRVAHINQTSRRLPGTAFLPTCSSEGGRASLGDVCASYDGE